MHIFDGENAKVMFAVFARVLWLLLNRMIRIFESNLSVISFSDQSLLKPNVM